METHASSLPSHFRFGPAPSSPFFTAEPDDPASSVPSVDVRTAKTRLEVLKGWEVNFSVLCLFFASTIALVYMFVKLKYTAAEWHDSHVIPPLNPVESGVRLLLQAASVALPLFYITSLYVAPTVTDEQIWTCIVLSVALLVSNPLTRVHSLISRDTTSFQTNHALKLSDRLYFPLDLFSEDPTARLIIGDSMYTAAIYLYLILSAHSYRVFDVKSLHTLSFYAPKVALALFFFAVKLIAGFKAGVSLGLVPYSRLITWFILYAGDRHSLRVTIPVFITTVLDTAFAFWLVSEVARTAEFLATVPYVENRAKQLGFRCFVFQTLAFCCNMIGLSLLVTYMLPVTYIYDAYDNPTANFLQLEPPVARLGLAFVYFTWTLVVAYVNLPPEPIIPFARRVTFRVLYLFRNSRVAAWLGLADIVTAEDPPDVDEIVDNQVEIRAGKGTIPLRYRHREIFDHILLSPETAHPLSPLILNPHPMSCPPYCDLRKVHSLHEDLEDKTHETFDLPVRSLSSATTQPMDIIWSQPRRPRPSFADRPMSPDLFASSPLRLRSRKNLFVMETQVLLANATYLSYIPGNLNEELKRSEPNLSLQHISSVSTGLEKLARRADGNSHSRRTYDKPQPSFDDGTKFLVDPYEMAERHGYRIHKHFCDEQLNTHAIILVNATRVIVAFSGTRDVTNWSLNANIKRVVLDDKLGKFEYELSDNSTDEDTESVADELNFGGLDYRTLDLNFDLTDIAQEKEPLRKTRSGEILFFGDEHIRSINTPNESKDVHAHDYGAIPSSADKNQSRRVPSTSSSPSARGSRTRQGVSMVASTLARELLTFGQAKVHEGFINAYMSLRKQIMGSLIELYKGRHGTRNDTSQCDIERGSESFHDRHGIGKSLPLFFCGHSLGGALATFASYEAARYYKRIGLNRRQDVSCTTFGCPRLGNEAFKARYEGLVETHWRFEIASDPIPKLPGWVLNYVPVGVQVLMDQSGMLLIDPSFIEVQWWGQLSNWYMGYRLHIRASYCMALRTYCKLYKNGADDLAEKFWPFPLRVQTKGLFRQVNQ